MTEWLARLSLRCLDRWSLLEWGVVIVFFINTGIESLGTQSIILNANLARIFRLLRIIRLIRASKVHQTWSEGGRQLISSPQRVSIPKSLRQVLKGIIKSRATIINLGALLLLLFFCIGVICISFMGNMCVQGDEISQFR